MADDDPEAQNLQKAFTLAKYGEWKEFKALMESDHVRMCLLFCEH